ncbi:MAG: hypothetical protein K2X99_10090 [Gemmatimonadaceae bacterium]|nr:hypothetical protein [Gemmatimonadaceae bacterium]
MHPAQRHRLPIRFAAIVAIALGALLSWQHLHGGVPSHSFLARKDYPSISNWWGLLLLPALTWGTSVVVLRRGSSTEAGAERRALTLGAGALIYGAAMAFSFAIGAEQVTGVLFPAMPLLALIWPTYRAEALLGFVLGMSYTFGAVLPTFIGTVVVLISAVVHLGIRPWLLRLGLALLSATRSP